MNKRIIHKGKSVINDLPYECCANCYHIASNSYTNKICEQDNLPRKISYDEFGDYSLFICDASGKKRKVFDECRFALKDSTKELVATAEKAINNASDITKKDYKAFTHNAKSIVAHAVLDLDSIIKQNQSITTNVQANVERVKGIISNDVENAALTCLKLSKHLLSLKAEYMSYDILHNNAPSMQPMKTNVRNVIITILHMFYDEFKKKNIIIKVEEWRKASLIDYNTFLMATYYIIENALKYCKDNSCIDVKFVVEKKDLKISFEMMSLFIEHEDEKHLFEEGYSGHLAIKNNLNGHGIGMFNAYKLIELNDGTLTVEAGEIDSYKGDTPYAKNIFCVTLPFV